MKTATIILAGGFALLAIVYLAACETVENEDGTRTTRVDAAAIKSGTDAATGLYREYRAQQQPAYRLPVYNAYGQPIYPTYP